MKSKCVVSAEIAHCSGLLCLSPLRYTLTGMAGGVSPDGVALARGAVA